MAAQDRTLAGGHRPYQQPDEARGQRDVQHVLQVAQQRILQRRRLQRGNQQQQRPSGGQRQPEHATDARTPPIAPFQPVVDPQDQPRADAPHQHRRPQRPCIGLCAFPVHGRHLHSNSKRTASRMAHERHVSRS
ncbi:hypothetical protein G6F35_017528 [Rhizopus arrhizus]|nr:hypothetical protein G6F35_017528 [Rhizopus arrhizus]